MSHWSETWGHTIVASILLKNNKIKLCKIGQSSLKDKAIEKLINEHPEEYSYQEKIWTVHNIKGHNKVFWKYAPKWLRQWELHEDFQGDNTFEKCNRQEVANARVL